MMDSMFPKATLLHITLSMLLPKNGNMLWQHFLTS
jgi:hypothetical protein